MLIKLCHQITSRTAILTRVKFARFFSKDFTNCGSEGQTAVRVNVNFANSTLRRLAQLLFRDTDGIRQFTAVLIYNLNIL